MNKTFRVTFDVVLRPMTAEEWAENSSGIDSEDWGSPGEFLAAVKAEDFGSAVCFEVDDEMLAGTEMLVGVEDVKYVSAKTVE